MDKLDKELEETKRELALKNTECSQAQNKCKNYNNQLETISQDVRIINIKI